MAVSDARLTQEVVEVLGKGTSEAKVSQQVVEVLNKGTSEARVTQQYVEVLMQTGNWARLSQQYVEAITNVPIVLSREFTDTITIAEDDDSEIIPFESEVFDRDSSDTLTITETYTGLPAKIRSGTDTVIISEDNVVGFIRNRSGTDTITLSESYNPVTNLIRRDDEDIIVITESDVTIVGPTFGYTDELTITETDETLLIPNYNVEDEIEITESNTRTVTFYRATEDIIGFAETNLRRFTYTRDAEDTLVPTDKAFGERHDKNFTDTIVITESTLSTRVLSRSASDTIEITETNSIPRVVVRSAIDTLVILDNIPRFVEGIQFSVPAFIGLVIRSDLYDSCENVNQPHCILSGMHYTVALPNPIFGDGESNTDQLRVFRTTTNRRVITVKRQQLKTLNYSFRLTRKKAIELRNLIRAEIDNQVTWRNWKGEMWVGTIGTNPFTVQADGRWGPCTEGMTVELELKAVRVI